MFNVAIYANQITFDGVGCSYSFSFLFSPSSASHSQRFDLVFKYVPVRFVLLRLMCVMRFLLMCFSFSFAFERCFPAHFLSLALFYWILLRRLFCVPWTNLRCVSVCVFGLQSFIFLVFFFLALFCFHSKLWLSRNSCVTIGIFHFYWIHNEGIHTITRSVSFSFFLSLSLSVSVGSGILFIIIKMRTVLKAWKWLCLRVIVMLEARCIAMIQWNLHTA